MTERETREAVPEEAVEAVLDSYGELMANPDVYRKEIREKLRPALPALEAAWKEKHDVEAGRILAAKDERIAELEQALWPDSTARFQGESARHWYNAAKYWQRRAQARAETLESALRTIRGPEDRGPWITIYREAGGGYTGLQAIARAALAQLPTPPGPAEAEARGEAWPELWTIRRADGTGPINLYGGDPSKHISNTYAIRRYIPDPQDHTIGGSEEYTDGEKVAELRRVLDQLLSRIEGTCFFGIGPFTDAQRDEQRHFQNAVKAAEIALEGIEEPDPSGVERLREKLEAEIDRLRDGSDQLLRVQAKRGGAETRLRASAERKALNEQINRLQAILDSAQPNSSASRGEGEEAGS